MKPEQITTVYYNSACPVCDGGICKQRARMTDRNVEWVDVHAQPEVASELGIDLEALRVEKAQAPLAAPVPEQTAPPAPVATPKSKPRPKPLTPKVKATKR